MVYADLESVLVPQDNSKENPKETYWIKYQKYVASSYKFILVCVDKKVNKPFKTYLGKDAVHNALNNMIKKVKIPVSYHCHTTREYSGSAQRDCKINTRLNHKIHVVFHNVKSYDSCFIMQELDKFNLKTNVIPNGLKNYASFQVLSSS